MGKLNGRGGGIGRPGAIPGRGRTIASVQGRPSGLIKPGPAVPGRGGRGVVGGRPPRGASVVRPGSQFVSRNGGAMVVANGRGPAVEPLKKHFVDSMLLEADRTVNRFRSLINEIRRSWYTSSRDDKTVILATRKIREAFVSARVSIEATDSKVIDIYRTNLEDADVRDIEPGTGDEQRLIREEEIFAKSELVDQNGIESLETTPDLPFREAAVGLLCPPLVFFRRLVLQNLSLLDSI